MPKVPQRWQTRPSCPMRGALENNLRQLLSLGRVELAGTAGLLAVVEAEKPLGVVTLDGAAEGLALDAHDTGGVTEHHAIKRIGEAQHPPARARVLLRAPTGAIPPPCADPAGPPSSVPSSPAAESPIRCEVRPKGDLGLSVLDR